MKKTKLLTTGLASVAALALWAGSAQAEVVGYNRVTVLANSDAVVSVPFNADTAYTGTVTAVSGSQITDGAASFTAGQYAGMFYVRFTSGTANGKWSTVTANSASALTVEALPAGVAVGNTFVVVKHWTLALAFPARLEGTSFIASIYDEVTEETAVKTEVFVFNTAPAEVNRSASKLYLFLRATAVERWIDESDGSDATNVILPPNTHVVVRNGGNNSSLSVYTMGEVEPGIRASTVPVVTAENDLYLASDRPTDLTPTQLGLAGTAAFKNSTYNETTEEITLGDQLYTFDNSDQNVNKSAAALYAYVPTLGGWINLANGDVMNDVPVIKAGEGFVIRKAAGTASLPVWSEPSPY